MNCLTDRQFMVFSCNWTEFLKKENDKERKNEAEEI